MANLRYNAGRRAEWELKKWYEAAGYLVIRSAGSRSAFDLVVIDPYHIEPILLIQVKRARTKAEADRLISSFRRNPPLSIPVVPKHMQLIAVKVPRIGWIRCMLSLGNKRSGVSTPPRA